MREPVGMKMPLRRAGPVLGSLSLTPTCLRTSCTSVIPEVGIRCVGSSYLFSILTFSSSQHTFESVSLVKFISEGTVIGQGSGHRPGAVSSVDGR